MLRISWHLFFMFSLIYFIFFYLGCFAPKSQTHFCLPSTKVGKNASRLTSQFQIIPHFVSVLVKFEAEPNTLWSLFSSIFQLLVFIIHLIFLDLLRLEHRSSNHDIFDSLGMQLLHGYSLSFGIALPSYQVIELIIHEEELSTQSILIGVRIYLGFVSLLVIILQILHVGVLCRVS